MAKASIADAKTLTPYQSEVADELMDSVWPRFSRNFEDSEDKAREFVEKCVQRVAQKQQERGGIMTDDNPALSEVPEGVNGYVVEARRAAYSL